MKIKLYKNIMLFGVSWILFFFATEFIMNIIFEDKTPFWKILAVSFISGFGMIYPFLKNSRDFSINKVLKKQERLIIINQENSDMNLNEKIIEQLKLNNFKILKFNSQKIVIKSKWTIHSFGEKYNIDFTEKEIKIESLPNMSVIPIDNGRFYQKINLIEQEIINLLVL